MRRRCSTSMDLWKEKKKTEKREVERENNRMKRMTMYEDRTSWEEKRVKTKKGKKGKGKKKKRNGRSVYWGWRVTMAGRVIDNGGEGRGKKVMEASQVVVRQVPRSICTVAGDRHCPLDLCRTREYPSPEWGLEFIIRPRASRRAQKQWWKRGWKRAGPRTFEDHSCLSIFPLSPSRVSSRRPPREDWKEASMHASDDRYSWPV